MVRPARRGFAGHQCLSVQDDISPRIADPGRSLAILDSNIRIQYIGLAYSLPKDFCKHFLAIRTQDTPLEPANSSENQPLPTSGPLLGIDFGTVRIGLAVCDQGQKLAVPLTTHHRQEKGLEARYFLDLIAKEQVVGLVIGLPVHMSGDEGGKAAQARKFGAWLTQIVARPIHFIDERYTSVEAWNYLKEGGLKAAKRKKHVDKVAAQVILQAYLDAKNAQQKAVIGPVHADSPSEA